MLLGCGCLLALAIAAAPRLVLIVMWIFGPRINATFDSFIVPLLGLIFLPYTTVMYVLTWNPVTGVVGWDWVWVLLGLMLDVMKWASIYQNRQEVPGMPGGGGDAPPPAAPPSTPESPESAM